MQPLDFRIAELSPDQRELGLRLVLQGLDDAQFCQQAAAVRQSRDGKLASRFQMWGSFRGKKLTGSLLVQTQPGRTALLWPPRLQDSESPDIAQQLLEKGLQELAQSDACMAQCLVPTDAGIDADLLRSAGFRHVSDLLYLVCLASEFPADRPSSELEFVAMTAEMQGEFARLVDATYQGTLDCPAVNGIRNIEDVLLGYRATGEFDPARWLIVRHQGEAMGCLILTDYPEHETWELIYLALLPTARGKGLGTAVVRHAQWLAGQAAAMRLVLAVDAANAPALKMYAAAGFQAWDHKSVYIRVLSENGGQIL